MPSFNYAKAAGCWECPVYFSQGSSLKYARLNAFSQSSRAETAVYLCLCMTCRCLSVLSVGMHSGYQLWEEKGTRNTGWVHELVGEIARCYVLTTFMGRPLAGEECEVVSRNNSLLLSSVSQMVWAPVSYCCFLSGPRLFSCASLLRVLDETKKKWTSWTASHMVGENRHSLCFHFPLWQKLQAKEFSWHWAVLLWGCGDMSKVKLFFLPFSAHLFSDFLLQWGAGTSLLDSQALTNGLSSVGGCQNQCSCGWMSAENSYSAIMLVSLPLTFFFLKDLLL